MMQLAKFMQIFIHFIVLDVKLIFVFIAKVNIKDMN